MEKDFLINVANVLEIDSDLSLSDVFRDYQEWDSLALLSLLSMIDDEYEVIISEQKLNEMKTLNDILNFINNETS
tara:strand:- start:93 stop:317 length:225 start_codon:yes stop_codon:yes gene_type:complete